MAAATSSCFHTAVCREKVLRSFLGLFFLCHAGNHSPRASATELYTQPGHTLHQRLVQELLGNRSNYSFYCSIQPGSCSLSQNSGTPREVSPSPLWSQSQAQGGEPTVHAAIWKCNVSSHHGLSWCNHAQGLSTLLPHRVSASDTASPGLPYLPLAHGSKWFFQSINLILLLCCSKPCN